jgi:hypothetical protein
MFEIYLIELYSTFFWILGIVGILAICKIIFLVAHGIVLMSENNLGDLKIKIDGLENLIEEGQEEFKEQLEELKKDYEPKMEKIINKFKPKIKKLQWLVIFIFVLFLLSPSKVLLLQMVGK